MRYNQQHGLYGDYKVGLDRHPYQRTQSPPPSSHPRGQRRPPARHAGCTGQGGVARARHVLIWVERLCLAGGAMLLIGVGGNALYSRAAAASAVEAWAAARATTAQRQLHVPAPDTALWSEGRRAKHHVDVQSTLALLRVPSQQLTVPVLPGTDDATLNVGAGWLPESAAPGEPGNVAIAAHRDGYFRALKDVQIGDHMTLQTPSHDYTYRVEWTRVVDPDAVQVLAPTSDPALTLITCYPFYFVGSAPQRYIVRAQLIATRPYPGQPINEGEPI